ncbi:helicase-related protein [Leisingera methylohalidivorans]|uniref:Disulfide oxidoreductase n=1 Tax=Leisingera methylohalidivorans DSM 14336 TaxID=999552 RepID=V9VX48_9RHOB|nr:helicase-related protein [Leisingera methylohalidivorans]AHD01462.1 disulfide oxidoreductase [Leisingera methylohalidivorans DSM 14336]
MANASRIVAVLGPTNTGKTHYAIERMLGYRTGVMGFPLRLLAREVYDKVVAARGPSVVALVTGEERIVPPRAQYWICTVEAMPEGMGCDFLAIDEIQLCADPERGHVFTNRLLRARGTLETLFLGADTMRGPISALVPGVQFHRRERMSDLVCAGSKKISRMPPRTAIVGFSVDNVYAIAELIRRQKGGAAVVMGALSPRTRNAQVALYQNGEVDYLVATDAIGMGLNLDIDHVAFSSTRKFDGRRMRELAPNELAQIAGRAGRGMSHGTFGVTGDARPLDEGTASAIMNHQFTPLKKLNWRSADLQFGTVEALIHSLEASPADENLVKAREADDLGALKMLSRESAVISRTTNAQSVRLLWDICRIPDFRGISHAEHAALLGVIFEHLHGGGVVPDDWMARQIKRIDRTDGNIDALSKRLAFIRTWTYVAQRNGWLRDESHWRGETRAVEDRLSDALHERLTQRFVDRRTSVLLRRLKQKEALLAEVNDKGEVTVEGEFVGRLEGFRFSPDKGAQGAEAKALKAASLQALAPQFHLRADRFYNAPDTEIDYTEQGGLMWGEHAVGKLVAGADALTPQIEVFVDESAGPDVAQKVERRLLHFITRKINALFEPLLALQKDEELSGLARGFAFRMVENLGVLPRASVAQEVKDLDQDARSALRKHGIRFGQFTIFMPLLLKPAPTRLRLVLWSLANGLQDFPESPPPGLVTVPSAKDAPEGYDTMSGYRVAGERMIRIDMLERLADMLRGEDSRGGFEAKADMLSITGMTLEQFADLMQGLGYKAEKGERQKVKPAAAEAEAKTAETEAKPAEAAAEEAPATEEPAAEEPAADAATADAAPAKEAAAEVPAAEAEAAPAEETAPAEDTAEAKPGTAAAAEAAAEPEMEVFFTFTWGGNRGGRQGGGQRQQNRRPQGDGKPAGKGKPRGAKGGDRGKPGRKGGPRQDQGAKTYSARPAKKEKQIDPDNPFAAALMGLKQGD